MQADRVARGKLPVVEVGPSRPSATPSAGAGAGGGAGAGAGAAGGSVAHGRQRVMSARAEERLAARQCGSLQEAEENIAGGCSGEEVGDRLRLRCSDDSPPSRQEHAAGYEDEGPVFEAAASLSHREPETELMSIPISGSSSSRRRDLSSSPLASSLRERSPPSLSLCLDTTYNSLAQEDDRTHM